MSALWLFLKTGLGKAVALVIAVGAAVAYAFLRGRRTGAQAEADAEAVAQAAANQKAAQGEITTAAAAQEVHGEVAKLSDAPAQQVGRADPGTAAGRLRTWTRD